MIVEWFLGMVLGLIEGLASFLPEASDLGLGGLEGWFHGFTFLNGLFPLDTVVVCLGVRLGVEAGIAGYGLFRELWSLVPFIGGK